MEKAGIGEKYLFRGVTSGKIQTLKPSGQLSYTRFAELLKQKLSALGFPLVDFSPHSLRAGGATVAAAAGVPDRIIKRHSHWKSEKAKEPLTPLKVCKLVRKNHNWVGRREGSLHLQMTA